MVKTRNRLLVTLVPILVAATMMASVALARPRTDGTPSGTTAGSGIQKPVALPASGEPDVPQAPVLPQAPGYTVSAPEVGVTGNEGMDPGFAFIRGIGRIWAAIYLRVAF
jgi:hypothetical protein